MSNLGNRFRRRSSEPLEALPLPPLPMRELVGRPDPEGFEHERGRPVFPTIEADLYEMVLDFGCGCGRLARQLALAQAPTPTRYLGVDLHAGMIAWASENLTPRLPWATFVHHDVFNAGFNPDPSLPTAAPLPVDDGSVTFVLAVSVFTHLVQDQAESYLDEVARVLRDDGVMLASFFLFEKRYFPMMQDFQAALYINVTDPTNAVIFDREWLPAALDARGLRVRAARPPALRGFHWELEIARGHGSVELPPDQAAFGHCPPPVCSTPPHTIGA